METLGALAWNSKKKLDKKVRRDFVTTTVSSWVQKNAVHGGAVAADSPSVRTRRQIGIAAMNSHDCERGQTRVDRKSVETQPFRPHLLICVAIDTC